jgi:hypothetical protein
VNALFVCPENTPMDGIDHHAMRQAGGSEESASRMTEEAAGDGGWKLEDVRARPAENGGVIVTCSKRRERTSEKQSYEDTYQSKDYAFGSVDEALAYIAQELGGAQPSSGGGGNVPQPTTQPY